MDATTPMARGEIRNTGRIKLPNFQIGDDMKTNPRNETVFWHPVHRSSRREPAQILSTLHPPAAPRRKSWRPLCLVAVVFVCLSQFDIIVWAQTTHGAAAKTPSDNAPST